MMMLEMMIILCDCVNLLKAFGLNCLVSSK